MKDMPEAQRTPEPIVDHRECKECMEEWIYEMEFDETNFYIGLSTIIECLNEAIWAGALPEPPDGWLTEVNRRMS